MLGVGWSSTQGGFGGDSIIKISNLMLETYGNMEFTQTLSQKQEVVSWPEEFTRCRKPIDSISTPKRLNIGSVNLEKTIERIPTTRLFKKATCQEISSERVLMERPNFMIYVKMHLHLPFGKALYLVGSCKALGSWDVREGLRLEWNEEDTWRGSSIISCNDDVEYKYVIADHHGASNPEWQCGCNRRISLGEVENGQVYLNEKWNNEKITLQLITDNAQQVYLAGNCLDLGLWTSRRYMRSYGLQQKSKMLWSLTFHMEKNRDYLHYYYIKKQSSIYVKEQQPGRYLQLTSQLTTPQNFVNRVSVIRRPGEIRVLDEDSFKEFRISEVTEELAVGPYLRREQEVRELAARGVRAVLSLQSKQDMMRYGIEWQFMVELYRKHGIKAINLEILDRKNIDFINKSCLAVRTLNTLVQRYKKVYVHCTAGIYRSPQLIILFLVSFRQFGLSEATELVKRKRPYARPESGCLEVSLEQLQCEKENFEN